MSSTYLNYAAALHHLPLVTATREQLRHWYGEGVPIRDICVHFNVCRMTVHVHTRDLPRRVVSTPINDESLIVANYLAGWTKKKFAEHNLNWRRVKKILRRHNVTLRPSRRYGVSRHV